MIIQNKIILTEEELYNLIYNAHKDGFFYHENWDDIWKEKEGVRCSRGHDTCSYTERKMKGVKNGNV